MIRLEIQRIELVKRLSQRCEMGDTSAMLEVAWFGDERNRKQIVTFLCRCCGLSINALHNLLNVYS